MTEQRGYVRDALLEIQAVTKRILEEKIASLTREHNLELQIKDLGRREELMGTRVKAVEESWSSAKKFMVSITLLIAGVIFEQLVVVAHFVFNHLKP